MAIQQKMFIADILRHLDVNGSTGLDLSPGDEVSREAAVLIRNLLQDRSRMLDGDFTPEEIHNFCHKLPETVSAKDFASGCMAYQTQLYGSSPVMDLLRSTDLLLDAWGFDTCQSALSPAAALRKRIREQIL